MICRWNSSALSAGSFHRCEFKFDSGSFQNNGLASRDKGTICNSLYDTPISKPLHAIMVVYRCAENGRCHRLSVSIFEMWAGTTFLGIQRKRPFYTHPILVKATTLLSRGSLPASWKVGCQSNGFIPAGLKRSHPPRAEACAPRRRALGVPS